MVRSLKGAGVERQFFWSFLLGSCYDGKPKRKLTFGRPGPAVDHEYSPPTVDHLRFGKLVGPMLLGKGASDEPRNPLFGKHKHGLPFDGFPQCLASNPVTNQGCHVQGFLVPHRHLVNQPLGFAVRVSRTYMETH